MNSTEQKTDILINKLRNQKPALNGESQLTDNIMAQIHQTTNRKNIRVLFWIKAVSTVAAVFLLAMFVFQEKSKEISFTDDKIMRIDMSKIKPPCLINERNTFAEAYSCYMEYNKSRNKQTFINYITKIKNNNDYENNK